MKTKRQLHLMVKYSIILIILVIGCSTKDGPQQPVSLKEECLTTLYDLSDALIKLQIPDKTNKDFGAIQCHYCNLLHTRAGEAVYPFTVAYKNSREEKYLKAAIQIGNWLITKQHPDGSWDDYGYTGTTNNQLLMMSLAFPIIKKHLSTAEQKAWKASIKKTADWIAPYLSPDNNSINYSPTAAAALMMANRVIPDTFYTKNARKLARWTVAKMDEDYFITGEAARVLGIKYGVDVGYQIDMSLWGLGLYAKEAGDSLVEDYVQKSLKNCVYFVYPNGSIDNSWGSRCYKWTTYGSKTADGSQILFGLYATENARYHTAAIRNLEYLRGMMKDGIVGYGPHYFDIFDEPPCNHPTFARAKNLALAIEFSEDKSTNIPPLPTEQTGWVKYFPTINVALAHSENFMATISAYGYKDHGFLQTSSQTKYFRGEWFHMPVVEDIVTLTSRI